MSRATSALCVATFSLLALGSCLRPASAQVISLRTVPLAAGEQFLFLPSNNLGMGGVAIAVDDEALDPFVNPAKGSRVEESHFFASLTSYSISNENGGAKTFPVGVVLRSDRWFGGALGAMQQVDMGRVGRSRAQPQDPAAVVALPAPNTLDGQSSGNKYLQAGIGRTLAGGRYALAASAMLADLNATDGVEEVFANAWSIDEFGHKEDYRLAFTAELSGARTIEAVLVYSRTSMTHEVTSVAWTLTDTTNWFWTPDVQDEANLDKTSTWGAHLGYVQPIGETSWRVGGIFTANRKLHPKIPTYDLRQIEFRERAPIPRDPGDSWAYNLGLGLAYNEGPTTFGVDLVYEPADSHTWADAESDVTASDGSVIPIGAKTVENWFAFSNARMNIGLSHRYEEATFQVGVRARSYDYRLEQQNYVELADVSQTEQWIEWSPSWGISVRAPGVEVRYLGMASSPSHFPFFLDGTPEVFNPGAITDSDLLAPPTGDLTIPDETVVTHRITVSVPIR